jgi:hypothetical protein
MHKHPTGLLLLFVSYLIVANYAVDVLAGAFPGSMPLSGFKQAVTGA